MDLFAGRIKNGDFQLLPRDANDFPRNDIYVYARMKIFKLNIDTWK